MNHLTQITLFEKIAVIYVNNGDLFYNIQLGIHGIPIVLSRHLCDKLIYYSNTLK